MAGGGTGVGSWGRVLARILPGILLFCWMTGPHPHGFFCASWMWGSLLGHHPGPHQWGSLAGCGLWYRWGSIKHWAFDVAHVGSWAVGPGSWFRAYLISSYKGPAVVQLVVLWGKQEKKGQFLSFWMLCSVWRDMKWERQQAGVGRADVCVQETGALAPAQPLTLSRLVPG